MKIYEKEVRLYYYDVDKDKFMSPRAMLKYFDEVSAVHNNINSGQEVEAKGYGWMLNKWKVKINKYPKLYENILIKTWISKIDRFFVNREYSIEDRNGQELVSASSLWIFIDMDKRRPARLSEDLIDYDLVMDKFFFNKFTRFNKNMEFDNEIEFRVRRSDIDINQHVNNLVYFDWILEEVPEKIYFNYKLRSFEIDYRREITYPATIKSKNKIVENGDISILHGIYDQEKDANVYGESNWDKNFE